MKFIQKYLYPLLLSIALLLAAVFCAKAYAGPKPIPLPRFTVQNPKAAAHEEISVFHANDGDLYVFLPSYANMEQITILLPDNRRYSLGDVTLSDHMSCSCFELETSYNFTVSKKEVATLSFYKSANVATMYINTSSGSMKYIHADKNYKETVSMTLYTSDGELDFSDENSVLKGRGNSTWKHDKRPYSLRLSSFENLLGMGAGTDWCLLANYLDHSNLNNKIVSELASRVGFPWSPKCEYVDVYLNGAYSGLYLLCEKVETGSERLDIDTSRGDFLCTFDFSSRTNGMRNYFYTNAGRTVEICEPEILSEAEKQRIEALVNQQEKDILSSSIGNAESVTDIDSWIRRYLIDELTGNTDADLSSSYFYCSDGKLYAGPVWDYDIAFGNTIQNANPQAFTAKNRVKYSYLISPYYSVLFNDPLFRDRIAHIYQEDFLPVLTEFIDHDIQSIAETIHSAAVMNSIRWPVAPVSQLDFSIWAVHPTSSDTIVQYLRKKASFLNDAFVNRTDYATLQFEIPEGDAFWSVSVPVGSILETTDIVNDPFYTEIATGIWIDSDTGDKVDLSQPVVTDMMLSKIPESTVSPVSLITPVAIVYLCIAVAVVTLMGFIMICIVKKTKKEEHCR